MQQIRPMVKYYIKNSIWEHLLQATIQLSLLFGTGLGLALSIAVIIDDRAVYAQAPENAANNGSEKTISQENVLFVNPGAGDDNSANGAEATPLKTITRALQLADNNTVIILSRGTYSQASGEEFPLIIKPGVRLQGDTNGKGRGIIIQGGGEYLSRSFGRQNVALVVGDDAAIAGITVTNPEKRGYGILIESSNPEITGNTFINSVQDGISVTGSAAPKIHQNNFYGNKANGITISGNARPEISQNVFQRTGFGINIAQNAQPIVTDNKIQYNRAGVIVQANARPILRNNIILGNREDGLVAIAQAMPNLGSDTEPGNNQFSNNVRYDINAKAAKQIITSVGNTINRKKTIGRVAFSGGSAAITHNNTRAASLITAARSRRRLSFSRPQPPSREVVNQNNNNRQEEISSNEKPSREITFSIEQTPQKPTTEAIIAPISRPQPQISALSPTNRPQPQFQSQPQSQLRIPASNPRNQPQSQPRILAPRPSNGFPTPTSLVRNQGINPPNSQYNYQQVNPSQPPSRSRIQPPAPAPTPVAALGSVPITAPNPGEVNGQMGVLYRVIVPVTSNREEEIIRSLAPGAFRTAWQGQNVIQVGVFSSSFNADQMLRILNSNGLKGMIQPLN